MAEYKAQKVTNREVQNAQHAAWPHSVKAPKPMKVSDKEVKKAQHEAWPHSYPAPKSKRTTSDGYMPKRETVGEQITKTANKEKKQFRRTGSAGGNPLAPIFTKKK